MTLVVWTPTCRPGLDVAVESIRRQTVRDDIHWILGDDLFDERNPAAYDQASDVLDQVVTPNKLTAAPYSLDAGHNEALRIARDLDADLFVSLADYTWIPPDGVERFQAMAARHPDALLTGIAHTSQDPDASQIVSPRGDYTIFAEPYTGRPATIGWEDCRTDRARLGVAEQRIEPGRWEFNWAAIPKTVLMDDRLNFDERYDSYHSCDNVDFALRASLAGHETWIDYENAAIRLPRRTYWPEEQRFAQAERDGKAFFDDDDRGDEIEPGLDEPHTGFYSRIVAGATLDGAGAAGRVRAFKHWRTRLHPFVGVLQVAIIADHVSRSDVQLELLNAGYQRIGVTQDGPMIIAEAVRGPS